MAKRSQAPGDATVLKRFFRDNFVIFRIRSKRIAFLKSVTSSTLCLYANFQFSWWSSDHFLAPLSGLYLPNAWSQTLQTSKSRLSIGTIGLGKTVSCRLCAGQSRDILKTRKDAVFWIWLCPRYKIPESFTIPPVFTSTLTVCRRNRRRLYRT